MKTIKEILMKRDGKTTAEAEELIMEAQDAFDDYLNDGEEELASNICQEFFGLEPDYLTEFM
jgi:hypothetical protein